MIVCDEEVEGTGGTGPAGPTGATGATGAAGANGSTGSPGAAGQGVPVGGTAGQVLSKTSGADFDTQWVPMPSGDLTSSAQLAAALSDETGLGTNGKVVLNENPTIIGFTQTGVAIIAGVEMPALAINVAEPLNTKSLTANAVMTFSATPTPGTWTDLKITVDATDRVVTIPSSWSFARKALITSVTVVASSTLPLAFYYTGTRWEIHGDPVETTGTGAYVLASELTTLITNQINVASYGLFTNATVTTATFVAAIAALTSNQTLYVPAGSYTVNDELLFDTKTGITITTDGATITQAGTSKSTFHLRNCTNCEVLNFKLVGKGTETPWAGANTSWLGVSGIHINNSTNIRVRNNTLSNHAGGGIVCSSDCDRIKVTGNTVAGMGSGSIVVQDNGSDSAIGSTGQNYFANYRLNNSEFRDNTVSGHAFGITGSGSADYASSNLAVSGNTIFDIPGQHGIYVQDIQECTLSDNMIENTALIAVKVQYTTTGSAGTATAGTATTLTTNKTFAEDLRTYEIVIVAGPGAGDIRTIASNTIGANGVVTVTAAFSATPTNASTYNIRIPMKNVNVISNTIFDCQHGVVVGSITGWMKDVAVIGNTIQKIGSNAYGGGAGDGIYVRRASSVLIDSNNIDEVKRYGIYGDESSGTIGVNNVNRTAEAGVYWIATDDTEVNGLTITDAVQTTAAAAAGRLAYFEVSIAGPPRKANPVITFNQLTMQSTLPHQVSLANSIYTYPNVIARVRGVSNLLTKILRFDTAPTELFLYSPNSEYYSSPGATPILGRGRHEYYATQSPQIASPFIHQLGDFCKNVTYSLTVLGDGFYSGDLLLGWMCIYANAVNAGLWQAVYADNRSTVSVAIDTTLDIGYSTVRVDATGAARTITLLAAANCKGKVFTIKKTDSSVNTVTIDGNGAETIDGATTKVLRYRYDSVQIQSNGTNWEVINSTVNNILSATATLNFASILAGGFEDLTITVTGAVVGSTAVANPPVGSVTNNITYDAWVSATDTVTVRASNNNLVTAMDPASGIFRATVINF